MPWITVPVALVTMPVLSLPEMIFRAHAVVLPIYVFGPPSLMPKPPLPSSAVPTAFKPTTFP